MKVINYFLNGEFMYQVDDKAFITRMEESYFLNFNRKAILDALNEQLSEDVDVDEVMDEIMQTTWDKWNYDASGNFLSSDVIAEINKKFSISLTSEIFGEMTYYDCDGNTTDITYSEALSGIGRLEHDTTIYTYELAED